MPVPTHCIEYGGPKDQKGYGMISVDGVGYRAHRYAWMRANNKEIPKGLIVCHSCDNPSCWNPAHLFLGTHKDNMIDKKNKGRCAFNNGELNGMTKLTADQVRSIHHHIIEDKLTLEEIGDLFGVAKTTVFNIKIGRTWIKIFGEFYHG